jgi:hypothetical protein
MNMWLAVQARSFESKVGSPHSLNSSTTQLYVAEGDEEEHFTLLSPTGVNKAALVPVDISMAVSKQLWPLAALMEQTDDNTDTDDTSTDMDDMEGLVAEASTRLLENIKEDVDFPEIPTIAEQMLLMPHFEV